MAYQCVENPQVSTKRALLIRGIAFAKRASFFPKIRLSTKNRVAECFWQSLTNINFNQQFLGGWDWQRTNCLQESFHETTTKNRPLLFFFALSHHSQHLKKTRLKKQRQRLHHGCFGFENWTSQRRKDSKMMRVAEFSIFIDLPSGNLT